MEAAATLTETTSSASDGSSFNGAFIAIALGTSTKNRERVIISSNNTTKTYRTATAFISAYNVAVVGMAREMSLSRATDLVIAPVITVFHRL